MNAKQAKQARMSASRAVAYTYGPFAVTCTLRHPDSLAVIGYGIGRYDEATAAHPAESLATIRALDSLRPLA